MVNPWINLPLQKPFLLPSDKGFVLSFNKKVGADYQIHAELLPEPFLGNPKAKIIFLNLNPGYSELDPFFHKESSFIENSRKNLAHAPSEFTFFLLNPDLSDTPGHKWWEKKLKVLIERYGMKKIANEVCCIEYFPYHTKKYKHFSKVLDSQKYSFDLVREAISRDALIIIMRKEKDWIKAIPELESYGYFTVKNKLNPCISKNNLPDGFNKILEKLDLN